MLEEERGTLYVPDTMAILFWILAKERLPSSTAAGLYTWNSYSSQ